MGLTDMLAEVRNDRIHFVTMRPPDSEFAVLERRVVVTGPSELVELCRTGDIRVLDELVNLLGDPERAWAALVLLAAMTQRDEKIVEAFATTPDDWWHSLGTHAREQWRSWLMAARGKLQWQGDERCFSEIE